MRCREDRAAGRDGLAVGRSSWVREQAREWASPRAVWRENGRAGEQLRLPNSLRPIRASWLPSFTTQRRPCMGDRERGGEQNCSQRNHFSFGKVFAVLAFPSWLSCSLSSRLQCTNGSLSLSAVPVIEYHCGTQLTSWTWTRHPHFANLATQAIQRRTLLNVPTAQTPHHPGRKGRRAASAATLTPFVRCTRAIGLAIVRVMATEAGPA